MEMPLKKGIPIQLIGNDVFKSGLVTLSYTGDTSDHPSAVRACVHPCVRLFLVYAINSTVFIRFFSNLFSAFIFIACSMVLTTTPNDHFIRSARAHSSIFGLLLFFGHRIQEIQMLESIFNPVGIAKLVWYLSRYYLENLFISVLFFFLLSLDIIWLLMYQ